MADEITGLGHESDISSYLTLGNLLTTLEADAQRRRSRIVNLGDLEAKDGYLMVLGKEEYPIDELARRALGSFLNIPVPYLSRIGNTLAEENINWHFQQMSDISADLISNTDGLVDVKSPDSLQVTPLEVVGVLSRIMPAETLVVRVDYGLNSTTIDLANPNKRIEPHGRVGDVTLGGLRVMLPKKDFAPTVGTYLHRLWCSNGAYHVVTGDQFAIKGLTHDDILGQFESLVSTVYNRIEDMLDAYIHLDERPVDNPVRMVQVYGTENGISPRYIGEAIRLVEDYLTIDPDKQWTMYDIMQVFTSLTHLDSVKENTRNKLMALGGRLVGASAEERRCGTCSHLLSLE